MIAKTGIVSLGLLSGLAQAAPAQYSSYDYVIVGSGPGGLVTANRLTENPRISVAVIEAGTWAADSVGNMSSVPAYNFPYNLAGLASTPTGIDWNFTTTAQPQINNQVLRYPRGRCLGGSTNLNAMAWSVSSRGSFDLWAKQVQDPTWTFDTVLKYYKKAMNFTPPADTRFKNGTPAYNPADTQQGGPLQVSYPAYTYGWTTHLAKAVNALGMTNGNSFLGGKLSGSAYQVNAINHKTGQRSSADQDYLKPFMSRPNLHVFDKTMAERVIFNGTTAVGVSVSKGKGQTPFTLTARREVIVSGGAMQSPQLLKVSGVGPAAELKKFGIKVVADRPGVGLNMNDHIFLSITNRVNIATATTINNDPNAPVLFNTNQTGPLTNPGGEYVAFEKVPADLRAGFSASSKALLATLPSDWPEIEYLTVPAFASNVRTKAAPNDGYNYASIFATLIAPFSRGNVSLASASMYDKPVISPNWLTNNTDFEVAVAMFKRLRQIWGNSELTPSLVIGQEYYPGPSVSTDAQIQAHVRQNMVPIWHATASNKMGPASDPLAVVDPKSRVYGTKQLRVIDCSAFPFLPPGPAPQAIVYMLAEKIADDIKATWGSGGYSAEE